MFLFLPLIATIAAFPLSAQEQAPDAPDSEIELEAPHPADDDKVYVIAAFEFEIKGRTRPSALIHNGNLKVGERLSGMAGLEEYIRDRTRVLTNMRVLKDTVEMNPSVGGMGDDGSYPVTVLVRVEDTWNIIAIPPLPFFNSNTGFEITLKARDYNFLGTMSPLRVDFGYKRDENQNNSFEAMVDSNIPFTAWGRRWNFKFENTFEYRPDVEETVYFRNVTGLSVQLPFRATTLTVGFDESVTLNEENAHRYREEYGNFQSGPYMSSRAFASWEIPTGLTTASHGDLSYVMSPSVTFNHEMPGSPLQDFRRGPFLGFSHSLGFGRVDWHGNFRRGLSSSLDNSFGYDFFLIDSDAEPLSANLSFTGTAHFTLGGFMGVSARVQSRHWFYFDDGGFHDEGGDVLRGIADRSINTDAMLSLNTNFFIRVLTFAPSRWFDTRKLRFFDVEFQLSPMLDFAVYNDPSTGRHVAVAGGFEFMAFPEFMRSIYLRFSAGINLLELMDTKRFPNGNGREFSFGLGHFF